jgi:hypothetical protein
LAAPFCVIALFQIYIYSANIGWHSYHGFGARKLTHLLPLLSLGAAVTFTRVRQFLEAAPGRIVRACYLLCLAPLAFTFVGAAKAMGEGKIPLSASLSQAQFYGTGFRHGWSIVDRHIGPLAAFPGSLWFWIRHDFPMSAYRAAQDPLHYYTRTIRHHSFRFKKNAIHFKDKRVGHISQGGQRTKKGVVVEPGEELRVVFTAEWRVATDLSISTVGRGECDLELRSHDLFGDTVFGNVVVPKKNGTVHFSVPEGGFDSGINQFKFRVTGSECRSVLLDTLTIEDRRDLPPPFDHQVPMKFPRKRR